MAEHASLTILVTERWWTRHAIALCVGLFRIVPPSAVVLDRTAWFLTRWGVRIDLPALTERESLKREARRKLREGLGWSIRVRVRQ